MSKEVSSNRLVLPCGVWLSELSMELHAMRHPEPERALRVLQHICGRAGWQRTFQAAEDVEPNENDGMLLAEAL